MNRAIAPQARGAQGVFGYSPAVQPLHAFAARVLMMRAAEHSLDLQRCIWHNDLTGSLLLDALREAADRSVRVRLFNPCAGRSARALQFVGGFSRLNQRMHNKSLTVDNQITLIGGRNMGDAYLGATDEVVFADMDVLAVGPVISGELPLVWASTRVVSDPLEKALVRCSGW